MQVIKNNQHYVWKHYLKPWTVSGKIFCFRQNKIFFQTPARLAKGFRFYQAEDLNESELEIVEAFISRTHPDNQRIFRSTLEIYLNRARGSLETQINGVEDMHADVERTGIELLDYLYADDVSFWLDHRVNIFAYYLGMQYCRTKASLDESAFAFTQAPLPKKYEGLVNPIKISKVINLFFADTFGNWIAEFASPYLVRPADGEFFITGDQPVFNLHVSREVPKKPTSKIELYYPVTPEKALVLSTDDDWPEVLTKEKTRELNDFIAFASQEYLFADRRECLERFLQPE